MDKKVPRSSLQIAPYRTHTKEWDWRFDLKKDDTLDCADDYGIWYRSTVLSRTDLDVQDCEGNTCPQITIACRYKDPYGAKEDDEGNKVTGWISSKFDFSALIA